MKINAFVGIIMIIHVLELLICGMHSNPKVDKQYKVRDLACILGLYVDSFVLQGKI